ncbi:prolipoprotein diacylglyceryl transferase [bacterium]|nr:prolipoprotein diacylglyceryl transferase [bacterium]
MHPEIFTIGSFTLRWYGLFMASAVFLAFWWTARTIRSRGGGLEPKSFEDGLVWAVISGIVGARFVYVATNWSDFQDSGGEVFALWHGGLSFHGGIIGGILAFAVWGAKKKIPLRRLLDLLAPPAALGIILGRMGNVMNGDDAAGRLTDSPLGFTWPESATGYSGTCSKWGVSVWDCLNQGGEIVRGPVHFSQLYGMAVGAILFGILWWGGKKLREEGWLSGSYIMWYSVLRSVIEEPFRDNPLYLKVWEDPSFGGASYTLTQLVSFPLALVGLWMVLSAKGKGPSPWTGNVGEWETKEELSEPSPDGTS